MPVRKARRSRDAPSRPPPPARLRAASRRQRRHGCRSPCRKCPSASRDTLQLLMATSETAFMSQHSAEILWQRADQDFLGNRYSRHHVIRFDGGAEWVGSSSPHVVPVPLSDPAGVDPEEAFVASLA